MDDLNIALRLLCQLQSVIHSIDELSDTVLFKHDLKKRTKSYQLVIENKVNQLADVMDISDMDQYLLIVKKLDNLAETIKITKDETTN